MKLIGNVVHLAKSGKLIGRSSQSPPIGATVYNKKDKIGKIYNVFGPTKNPYISIILKVKKFKYNINDELYISKSSKDKRRKKLRKKK